MSKFHANGILFSAVETNNSNIYFTEHEHFIVCQIL